MYEYILKKTGEKVYLHKVLNGTRRAFLWYFNKNQQDAVDLPPAFEVVESPRTGYPIVRKKRTGV
jgi:hypothetical protein